MLEPVGDGADRRLGQPAAFCFCASHSAGITADCALGRGYFRSHHAIWSSVAWVKANGL